MHAVLFKQPLKIMNHSKKALFEQMMNKIVMITKYAHFHQDLKILLRKKEND